MGADGADNVLFVVLAIFVGPPDGISLLVGHFVDRRDEEDLGPGGKSDGLLRIRLSMVGVMRLLRKCRFRFRQDGQRAHCDQF